MKKEEIEVLVKKEIELAERRLEHRIFSIQKEFRRYEDEYRRYLKKRHRVSDWFETLYRKIRRKGKFTRTEIRRRTRKRMAKIFYKGGQID